MNDLATPMAEHEFAELVTWSMCKIADGGGPGKCDPFHCVCGIEGRVVARDLYSQGYLLVKGPKG